MLLGLFLGALGGFVQSWSGPGFDGDIDVTLNPLTFEQYLIDGRSGRKEVVSVRDLTVHPPFDESGVDWVTGVAVLQYNARENPADPNSPMKRWEQTQPFRFSKTVSFAPQRGRGGVIIPLEMGDPAQYPDNRTYLTRFAEKFPDAGVTFRYAWWDAPELRIGAWMVVGFVVFGLILPMIVRLIVPAPEREKSAGLGKVRSAKPQPVAPKGPSAEDEAQLEALEAQLEKNLEGAFPAGVESDDEQDDAPAPIRTLNAGPVEAPQQAPTPQEAREYAGEFYPTVAHAPKKDPNEKE